MFHSDGKVLRVRCGAIATAFFCFAYAAHADVTIKQSAETSGLGGILDSKSTTVTYLQGDKKCDETETRMTGKLMKLMGGGKPVKTASIIRLDKGVIWNIDHKSKTYTEMPLQSFEEAMQGLQGSAGEDQSGMDTGQPDFDTSRVTMLPPKIDYKLTGKTEVIAGHSCEQGILTMETEGVDKETGDKFKLITVIDAMLAKDVTGMEEYNLFNQHMAEKMGMGADAASTQSMLSAMGAYGIDPKKLAEEAGKMEGFPMVQIMTLRGEGSQFAEPEEEKPAEEGEAESGDNGMAAKALSGLFGKKDKKEEPKEKDDAIIRVTMRVTEISTDGVNAERFDTPANYKLSIPPADK